MHAKSPVIKRELWTLTMHSGKGKWWSSKSNPEDTDVNQRAVFHYKIFYYFHYELVLFIFEVSCQWKCDVWDVDFEMKRNASLFNFVLLSWHVATNLFLSAVFFVLRASSFLIFICFVFFFSLSQSRPCTITAVNINYSFVTMCA